MTIIDPSENVPSNPWQGDSNARLQQKLSLLGFRNLEEFLDGNPGEGYVRLAKLLDDANVAAMQIYNEQIRRGNQTNNIRFVAMDCLVRFLNEYLPRGWKNGRHSQHRTASAFASWFTAISAIAGSGSKIELKLKNVFDALEAMPLPLGWLPKNKDDVFVVEAFETGWPIDDSTRELL